MHGIVGWGLYSIPELSIFSSLYPFFDYKSSSKTHVQWFKAHIRWGFSLQKGLSHVTWPPFAHHAVGRWAPWDCSTHSFWSWRCHVGMDQDLLIPFLGGWTSIYQLFWGSLGVQGFDTLPCSNWKEIQCFKPWRHGDVTENSLPLVDCHHPAESSLGNVKMPLLKRQLDGNFTDFNLHNDKIKHHQTS